MDISTVKPASELIMEILHPATGQALGIKVSVSSLDDEKMRRIKRKITDDQLQLQKKGKQFTAEQIDQNMNFICFSAMNGWVWEGEANYHGEKPTFTKENVYKVFGELPWFRDQIQTQIGETESFFGN